MLMGLFIAAVIALIIIYKFLPNKKIFPYLCVALLIVFAVSAFIQNRYNNEVLTRAQIEELHNRQNIFSEWYAEYQKDINSLDRNWQRYYGIVETLKTTEIYEYTIYEQLLELEKETIDEQQRIHSLKVPPELDAESSELLASVINKTKIYADAQVKTISLTRKAANPEGFKNLNALNKRINEINIREAPAGLFTATEIAAIRNILGDVE
ncbi:MAG: hypothetical protein IKZ58_01970 [Selenomonadaceae bacterium]|nr:hypothetical protein [Selenomonadaceae bacterium]